MGKKGRYFTLPDGRTASSQRGRSFTDTKAEKASTRIQLGVSARRRLRESLWLPRATRPTHTMRWLPLYLHQPPATTFPMMMLSSITPTNCYGMMSWSARRSWGLVWPPEHSGLPNRQMRAALDQGNLVTGLVVGYRIHERADQQQAAAADPAQVGGVGRIGEGARI